jgi:hypothetical protein
MRWSVPLATFLRMSVILAGLCCAHPAAAGPLPADDSDVQSCSGGDTDACKQISSRLQAQCPTDINSAQCMDGIFYAQALMNALTRQSQDCAAGESHDCDTARTAKIMVTTQFQAVFSASNNESPSRGSHTF